MSSLEIRTLPFDHIEDDIKIQCAELWQRVWPSPSGTGEEGPLDRVNARYAGVAAQEWHIAFDHVAFDHVAHNRGDATGSGVVGVGRTFRKDITIGDTKTNVLALASVCTDPSRRGEGFGDAIARAVFERSSLTGTICLFQTGVPGFYTRLGAATIDNEVMTSVPQTKPFDDDYVMLYPGPSPWGDLTIDLLGNGW